MGSIYDIQVNSKTICCDLDNTLIATNIELIKLGYNILSQYPCPELNEEFWKSKQATEILAKAKPIKSTLRLLETLKSNGADINYVTQRGIRLGHLTYSWFQKNNIQVENIFFVKEKLNFTADIYIEDDPIEIANILDSGKTVIKPYWEYNKHLRHKNLYTFYMTEVMQYGYRL